MALKDGSLTSLEEAVVKLAERSSDTANGQAAERYASAARQLAEAGAWLQRPGVSHGSNGSSD